MGDRRRIRIAEQMVSSEFKWKIYFPELVASQPHDAPSAREMLHDSAQH
jgi:hypothetical protein